MTRELVEFRRKLHPAFQRGGIKNADAEASGGRRMPMKGIQIELHAPRRLTRVLQPHPHGDAPRHR